MGLAHTSPTPPPGSAAAATAHAGAARWAHAVLWLVCVTLYARGLAGGYVIDDRTFFVENDDLPHLGLANAATVFLRPTNAWGDFQPIRDLLFLLEHELFGSNTVGHHAVSLALYGMACSLSFALARAFAASPRDHAEGGPKGSDAAAFLVAMLFATHPTHVETVAYICGQKELLAGVFSLGSLLAFQRGFAARNRRGTWVAAGIALYLLALLSKQTAIMLLLLVPLLYGLAATRHRPSAIRSAAVWAAVQVPALLWMIRSRAAFQELWASTSALGALPLPERIPLALKVLGAHARLALWPHPLSFGYPFDDSPRWDGTLAAGITAVVVLGMAAWWFRRDRAVVFGAAAFVLFLVPVLQLHGSLNNASIYDRYLFLPVLGLALVAERVARSILVGSPRAHAGLLAAVALAGGASTVAYVPAFADDVAVSRNSYERFPGWSRPAFELAYSLVEARRFQEAQALLAAEPSLSSPPWVLPYLRGWITLEEGRAAEAIPVLAWASSLATAGRYYPFPSIPLARALIETGRVEDAERELRAALASPIYQPLEEHHARKLLEEIARLRANPGADGGAAASMPGSARAPSAPRSARP